MRLRLAQRLALGVSGALCVHVSAATVVVENVTVIDVAAGTLRPHQTALIEGERILAVGPQGSVRVPLNARVVDGTGRFLSPGLWDMRVQLRNPDRQLPAFLAFGVTGIRGSGDYLRAAGSRLDIQKGRAIGPRIIASGPAVGGKQTAQTARLAFDRLFDDSVDFIQILPDLSREAYLALAEQARHWRLRFDGAVPADISPLEAVNARQRIIEGLSNLGVLTEETVIRFFEKCAMMGTRISPLLSQGQSSIQLYQLTALAKRYKVELLAGTGSAEAYSDSRGNLQNELVQLVAAGLSPREALESATLAPARMLGWDSLMGSVETGKIADLVLLDGNPLQDIGNTRRVAGVFAQGRYFSRQDLDGMLAGGRQIAQVLQ